MNTNPNAVLGLSLALLVAACGGATTATSPDATSVDTAPTEEPTGDAAVLLVQAPASATCGEPALARLTLRAREDGRLTHGFPVSIRIVGPTDADVTELRLRDAVSADQREQIYEFSFTPADCGEATFQGTASYGVCLPDGCADGDAEAAWTVSISCPTDVVVP